MNNINKSNNNNNNNTSNNNPFIPSPRNQVDLPMLENYASLTSIVHSKSPVEALNGDQYLQELFGKSFTPEIA
jgi:hypothetical protein